MIDNRFVLPMRACKALEDTEVSKYTGVKYLAVPALRDRTSIKIDGRQILEYDAVSDKICSCTEIDESSICVTDEIKCHYQCLGAHNYSC